MGDQQPTNSSSQPQATPTVPAQTAAVPAPQDAQSRPAAFATETIIGTAGFPDSVPSPTPFRTERIEKSE
jgi:hypothetical protein